MAEERRITSARLLHSMSSLIETCHKSMNRASRKLRSSSCRRLRFFHGAKTPSSWVPSLRRHIGSVSLGGCGVRNKKGVRGSLSEGTRKWEDSSSSSADGGGGGGGGGEKEYDRVTESSGEEDEAGLWRKTILMGAKCRPLDFSGEIYYDSEGRQLPGPPGSPQRAPCFAYPVVVSARRRAIHSRLQIMEKRRV